MKRKPLNERKGMAALAARRELASLDSIADVVLRYRPKPKSDAAKTRKRKARKAQRESCI